MSERMDKLREQRKEGFAKLKEQLLIEGEKEEDRRARIDAKLDILEEILVRQADVIKGLRDDIDKMKHKHSNRCFEAELRICKLEKLVKNHGTEAR